MTSEMDFEALWRRAEARCARLEQTLRNALQCFGDEEGESAEGMLADMRAALSDTAIPDTWKPDHPDFAKTDTAQQDQVGGLSQTVADGPVWDKQMEHQRIADMREKAARIIRALNIGLRTRQIEIIEQRIRALPIDSAHEGE